MRNWLSLRRLGHGLSKNVYQLQSIYVICRGLKFSLPQRVSLIEVQATFEKAYWKIEPLLEDPAMKELANSTLRSIALNYIERRLVYVHSWCKIILYSCSQNRVVPP